MEELLKITWSEDELVRELLDDDSPLFIVPHEEINISTTSTYSNNSSNYPHLSFFNQLIAKSVLLPETSVENASSSLTDNHNTNYSQEVLQPITRNSMLERGMCKAESKYTLRIRSNGNVLADDGYKWRKYGQKSIKNSSNPRSYYKCTNPRCSAKKQVERSTDDPETLIITYEGLHLHFTYPFLELGQSDNIGPISSKKPKLSSPISEAQVKDQQLSEGMRPNNVSLVQQVVTDLAQEEMGLGPQGLLEDMVPLVVRNPQVKSSSSHSSSVSSCSSPPTSPLSFCWSPPDYSSLYFNVGL